MSTPIIVLIILSVLGHIYFLGKKKTSNDAEAMAGCERHPIVSDDRATSDFVVPSVNMPPRQMLGEATFGRADFAITPQNFEAEFARHSLAEFQATGRSREFKTQGDS